MSELPNYQGPPGPSYTELVQLTDEAARQLRDGKWSDFIETVELLKCRADILRKSCRDVYATALAVVESQRRQVLYGGPAHISDFLKEHGADGR